MGKFDLPVAIVLGVASFQGFAMVVNLFFVKKGSRIANSFLLILILCITLIVFQNFIILSGYYIKFPYLIFSFYPLNALIGPLFLFYVLYLISPNRKFKAYDLLHLGLFCYTLYNHIDFLALEPQYKIGTAEYFFYQDQIFVKSQVFQLALRKAILIGYAAVSLYLILTKIRDLKHWSADTNQQYLERFKLIGIAFFLYSMSGLSGPLYFLWTEIKINRYEVYHHLISSAVIMALAIVAMHQPERLMFLLQKGYRNVEPDTPEKEEPSRGQVVEKVKTIMSEKRPYLDPNLKIYELARLTDSPPHVLSSQINQELNMNFYEFVNQYRVDEFKKRIVSEDYAHLTLLAIAYDVGFNSKASLNRVFKKQVGLTPSQYLNELKVSTS
ncbi:MAG: AraC family transcriptional regulator [Cyclobacteriaceae bacterium]